MLPEGGGTRGRRNVTVLERNQAEQGVTDGSGPHPVVPVHNYLFSVHNS
jgi:hypothetical protein